MYEYDSGTVLVTFSPPKLYQAKGADTGVQAEALLFSILETPPHPVLAPSPSFSVTERSTRPPSYCKESTLSDNIWQTAMISHGLSRGLMPHIWECTLVIWGSVTAHK